LIGMLQRVLRNALQLLGPLRVSPAYQSLQFRIYIL